MTLKNTNRNRDLTVCYSRNDPNRPLKKLIKSLDPEKGLI
jgi:hypothetical protein